MILYPTIQLQSERCVTLDQGRLDQPSIWHVDPVDMARGFAAAGAEWMHVTDFDAVEGHDNNHTLIETLIRAAGIPVQVGGGVRSRERVERWIDQGAGRVVLGTLAARDPELVRQLAKYYPDQIVLSVDIWRGQVMTEGWRQASAIRPEDYISAFDDAPLAGVILTDIDSDLQDVEAQLGLIAGLAQSAKAPVIASGVVRSVDDIARLKYVPRIAGALIGRALYNKSVALDEALRVAQPSPEMVADFR